MSKEFQQIVSLASKLDQKELVRLLHVIKMLQSEDQASEYQFSEAEQAEILREVERIDQGEVEMIPWEKVKAEVFGE